MAYEIKKTNYEKPLIEKIEKMNFSLEILVSKTDEKILCKQCSSCHGCK